jgi:hypothetical protein
MKFQLILLASFTAVALSSNIPMREHDPKTVKSCIEWYNNYEEESCEYIRKYFGITPEEFTAWNPSVNLNCEPWLPVSYCIVTKEKWDEYNRTHPTTATITTSNTLTTTSTSTLQPSPTGWVDLGCYVEGISATVLEHRMSSEGGDRALTIPKCQDICYRASLKFSGVKQGNECWCSSYVGGEWAKKAAECNTPCTGDSKTICGGTDRLNIFEAKEPENMLPSVSKPPLSLSATTGPVFAPETTQSKSGARRNFGFL